MGVKISDLLKNAGSSLKGKWLLSIGVSLVYIAINTALSFIPMVGVIVSLVIIGPLLVGLSKYYLSLVRNEEVSFNLLFFGFSNQNFARSFIAYILMFIFILLWSLIFIIPFFVILVVFGANAIMGSLDPMSLGNILTSNFAFLIAIILSFLLLIPAIIASLSYSFTFYVVADNPDISGFEAIKKSVQIMKGNKGKLFLLIIIFVIGALLCLLTLGIAYIWYAPFAMAIFSAFYNSIK